MMFFFDNHDRSNPTYAVPVIALEGIALEGTVKRNRLCYTRDKLTPEIGCLITLEIFYGKYFPGRIYAVVL